MNRPKKCIRVRCDNRALGREQRSSMRNLAEELPISRSNLQATGCLIAASLVVALAILANGSAAKMFNGIGGVLWLASAVMLLRSLRTSDRFRAYFTLVFAVCLLLVLLVKPANLIWALIGFGVGGVLVGSITGVQALDWGPLLPALWLPTHLLVAVARAAIRSIEGSHAPVRTDPPPTAALVPFAMVVAALAGAWLVVRLRNRSLANSTLAN